MIISLRTALHSITAVFPKQVQPIASPLGLILDEEDKKVSGSTEIWTRIAGFRVLSANHYTIEPRVAHLTDFLLSILDRDKS